MRPAYIASWLVIGLCAIVGDIPVVAQTSSTADTVTYGKTPEEYYPYSRFQNPYNKFFIDTLAYPGYGRHIPEPDHIDSVNIGFIGPIIRSISESAGGPEDIPYRVGQRTVRWDGFYASPLAPWGIKMLQGAKLAVEQANARGGYRDSIPYNLVVKNDNGQWRASGRALIDLAYKDSVWAVIGSMDGANSHVLIRVALKIEIPVMNTADTDPTFIETNIPWVIRNITDDRQMSYLLADYAYKKLGLNRVAALRESDRYGRMSIDEFRDASTRSGHPFLVEMQYQEGDTLFTTQLQRIKSMNAEGVVVWGNPREAGLIYNQMHALGMDLWMFCSDRVVSGTFLDTVGPDANKVAAGYPYNPTSKEPKYQAFVQAFQERFGDAPETYAAHAYDGAEMIIEAIRQVGLNRAKIRDALVRMRNYQGVTGRKDLDAVYSNRSPAYLAVLENGHWRFCSRADLFGKTAQADGKMKSKE